MLLSIQYLRFVAALLVVVYHATQSAARDLGFATLPVYYAGARGVDVFFVISGFIISYVTWDTKGDRFDFLAKRILRVAPPYWLATLVLLAVALALPGVLRSTAIDPAHVLASFLFIPWDHPVTVSTFPFLHVGWTLNSEMQFYLIFALFLGLGVVWRTVLASLTLAGIVLLGAIFRPENQTLEAWSAPIILEFIYGMFIALWWRSRAMAPPSGGPAATGALLLLVAGALAVLLVLPSDDIGSRVGQGNRWLTAGLPAAALVAGMLALEKRGHLPSLRSWKLLGDASYALYIWHFFVIGAVRALWPFNGLGGDAGALAFVGTCILLSVGVSILGYSWFEKPVLALGRGLLARLRPRPSGLPA